VTFPRKLLNQGEELVLDLRPHWMFLLPQATTLVVALAFGVLSLTGLEQYDWLKYVAAVVVLLALLWFLARYAVWATTNFVLTSDRLVSRKGVVAKSGIEIPLERINTVFFRQSIFERIIGSGDLAVESAGERGSESFSNIRKPDLVQREIYVQMENNENRKFDRVSTGVNEGRAGANLSVAEQLEKLSDLYQKGHLNQAEFEAQKARLLSS
jgi:uncharacterized membrane protein YdbT with pleckstrin-like domain